MAAGLAVVGIGMSDSVSEGDGAVTAVHGACRGVIV